MKTAILFVSLLAITGAAHSQVMVETVAERATRCREAFPVLLDSTEAFTARYETTTPTLGRDEIYSHIGKSKEPHRALMAAWGACEVAYPATNARAQALAERLQNAILAAYDRAGELSSP